MTKPRLFVGSSTEGLSLARAVQEELEHDAVVIPWNQSSFELGDSTLDSLIATLHTCDLGIFILKPDDIVISRDQTSVSARDNVIFELGLFLGKLGKKKAFYFVPKNIEDFRLPSDLIGTEPGRYDPALAEHEPRVALGPACNKVRAMIKKLATTSSAQTPAPDQASSEPLTPGDYVNIIATALRKQIASREYFVRFAEIDKDNDMPRGSTSMYVVAAADMIGFDVINKTEATGLLQGRPTRIVR